MSINGPILYPQVTRVPDAAEQNKVHGDRKAAKSEEFGKVLDQALAHQSVPDLNHVKAPLKFSAHASQRLRDRNIPMDNEMMARLGQAVDQAASKGIEESLVLTDDAALIVNVENRTVITALDRDALSGNVFTNIDGAVVI